MQKIWNSAVSEMLFVCDCCHTVCKLQHTFISIFRPVLPQDKLWQLRHVTCVSLAHNLSAIAAATVRRCDPTNTHPSSPARFGFSNHTSISIAISLVSQWFHNKMLRQSVVCNANIHVMAMSQPHMVYKRHGAKKSTKTSKKQQGNEHNNTVDYMSFSHGSGP